VRQAMRVVPPGGLEVVAPGGTYPLSDDFYCSNVGVLMMDA